LTNGLAGVTESEVAACACRLGAAAMWSVGCDWHSGALDHEPSMPDVYDRLTVNTGEASGG
jgi:hypothetical protein